MDIDLMAVSDLAVRAGRRVREIYDSKSYISSIAYKEDKTPVTSADLESNDIILSGLKSLYPSIPIISEESAKPAYEERRSWKRFWLVDPVDGTDEFILRNGEFTVNIALIDSNRPVLGVIYLPVQEVLYYADASGSFRRLPGQASDEIQAKKDISPEGPTAAMSRLHFNEADRVFLERNHIRKCMPKGSSIKFCMVAEGSVDVYYQGSRNMEWDTAAGQAIVEVAGGAVVNEGREPMRYNKESMVNGLYLCMGPLARLNLIF